RLRTVILSTFTATSPGVESPHAIKRGRRGDQRFHRHRPRTWNPRVDRTPRGVGRRAILDPRSPAGGPDLGPHWVFLCRTGVGLDAGRRARTGPDHDDAKRRARRIMATRCGAIGCAERAVCRGGLRRLALSCTAGGEVSLAAAGRRIEAAEGWPSG